MVRQRSSKVEANQNTAFDKRIVSKQKHKAQSRLGEHAWTFKRSVFALTVQEGSGCLPVSGLRRLTVINDSKKECYLLIVISYSKTTTTFFTIYVTDDYTQANSSK